MKPKQQNNPAVLGILGIAFLFILVRIFKTLTGGGEPLPPAKPDSAAQQKIAATGTGGTKLAVESARLRSRDPFDHPYLIRTAQEEAAKLIHNGGSAAVPVKMPASSSHGERMMTVGLPNVAPPNYKTKPFLTGFANSTSFGTTGNKGTGNREQGTVPLQNLNSQASLPPSSLAEKWRVTAILGGSHPTAVLESPEMSPRTVAVGDELQGFRIAAIRAREIVVASARTILTLPLETHGEISTNAANKTEQTETKEMKTLTAMDLPKSAEKPHEKSSN